MKLFQKGPGKDRFMNKQKPKMSWKMLLVIQLTVCFYTLSGIASKLASTYPFMSVGFILCYGMVIAVSGIYAIVWQQIIRRVDISIAYANRAMSVFWSMLWAFLLFHEDVTLQNLLGVLLIFIGTWVVNDSD